VTLHDAVADEVLRVLGYGEIVAGEAIDVIENLVSYVELLQHIPALLEEAVIHATNDHYLVSMNSHYVALGDANAYGTAADMLAAHLSAFLGAEVSYENATVAGQSAAELLAMLPELKETLEKADLVTVGFGANTFTQFVVDQVSAALMGLEVAELDWEAYLGEEGAAYVAEAMDALKAELAANGAGEIMGMDLGDAVALAIESYAYAYMEFVINYVQVVDGIHAINPEAQVVLVGMHNPMAGVVLDVEGTEIALGDYLEYLIKVSNAYAFGYAFIVPETIYVNAPTVETENEAGTQGALFFLMDLMMNGTNGYVPTETGHAYIEEQIWNALNVYKNGMLGDVDSDGDVDHVDAMLVLQYYTDIIGADKLDLSVADVDGNGEYNHVDAMLILQYYTEIIDVFPAA
jgi:lysophospholipase L1-like esterase